MAVQMFDDGTFEAIAHAVACRRDLPLAAKKQFLRLTEFVVLRTHYDADRTIG